jgi:hypothetical protein
MGSESRKVRDRLEGARERANAKEFARGAPGRIRRAVLRVQRAGDPRLSLPEGSRGTGSA